MYLDGGIHVDRFRFKTLLDLILRLIHFYAY